MFNAHGKQGPLAQLVERFHGMEEVKSSILLRSTIANRPPYGRLLR